jgi:hypothetical protein
MQKLLSWVKNNKLSTFLIIVVIVFLAKSYFLNRTRYMGVTSYDSFSGSSGALNYSKNMVAPSIGGDLGYYGEVSPQPQVQDRKVITNSSISLLVKDVRVTMDKIEEQVALVKGYVVNTSITSPEEGANYTW